VPALRQSGRDPHDIREKVLGPKRDSRAVSNHRIRRVVRYQRESGQDAT
jgi:hypothetical protein